MVSDVCSHVGGEAMRKTTTKQGIRVKAYSGSSGVLLAMSLGEEQRRGLLGFAIERTGPTSPHKWLSSQLHFPGVPVPSGSALPSNESPIQKFRWSDYTVSPGERYRYEVHPVYPKGGALDIREGPSVELDTMGPGGEHYVLFNRAAAASQAFSRTFPLLAGLLKDSRSASFTDEVWRWLSRGVQEQIVGIIGEAKDRTWALDIAAYEYEHPSVCEAVVAAAQRGAKVRIVYHAKPGDEQTSTNEESLASPRLPGSVETYARVPMNIMHNKFIVLSRLSRDKRRPVAVLTGSTNFTENGMYRQANVVHVIRVPGLAATYEALFEELIATAEDAAATKVWISENNEISPSEPYFVGFSPRSGSADLQEFVRIIQEVERDVLFSTAFDLHKDILDALAGMPHDPILRYGLQNKKSAITGYHADRTALFTVPALLPSGLEGWLKESWAGQKGSIHVHTKAIIADFTSDSPTVISGSHNLSTNASARNDENYLIIRGDRDLADAYGCEVLRLYDHYRFRALVSEVLPRAGVEGESLRKKAPTLEPTDKWTLKYFKPGTLHFADRERFAGR
jgi:phosphatidylserine/phosphatidylglycerophosphate/cardiolipin synthase-like enzyme